MLGTGEQLQELKITVGQLLDCSAKDVREWVWVCLKVQELTRSQHLPSSQRMGTLYRLVHPFW